MHMWKHMYLFLFNSSHSTNRCNFNSCVCVSSLWGRGKLKTRKGASAGADSMGMMNRWQEDKVTAKNSKRKMTKYRPNISKNVTK